MRLSDALFNWLQIHVVSEARPDDRAAKETADFFEEILREDHGVRQLSVEQRDDVYTLSYVIEDEMKKEEYPAEAVDQLLIDIESEPKYNR